MLLLEISPQLTCPSCIANLLLAECEGATSTMLVMCCNGTGSAVLHTKRVGLTEFLWSILCILRMHLRALLKLCRPRPSMEGSSELLCKSNHALHQTHYGRTKERGGGRRNTEGGRGDDDGKKGGNGPRLRGRPPSVARSLARRGGYGDNAKWGVRSRPIQSIRLHGKKKEREPSNGLGRNLSLVNSLLRSHATCRIPFLAEFP